MKKDRPLTTEERRLWREATRLDAKLKPQVREEEIPADAPKPKQEKAAVEIPVQPRKPSLPPLPLLTGRQASRLLKPHGMVQARLDLHGIGKIEAYGRVQAFVTSSHASGKRHLLIITGKGRTGEGVLRSSLPGWLNEPGLRRLIAGMAVASADNGGSGALHVLLRKAKHF